MPGDVPFHQVGSASQRATTRTLLNDKRTSVAYDEPSTTSVLASTTTHASLAIERTFFDPPAGITAASLDHFKSFHDRSDSSDASDTNHTSARQLWPHTPPYTSNIFFAGWNQHVCLNRFCADARSMRHAV